MRKTLRTKSFTPSKLSINVGGVVVSSSAIEFTVKSLRNKSPSILSPKFTSGFRLCDSYFSLRYVVISTVTSPNCAAIVPNSRPVSQIESAPFLIIDLVSSGLALVVKSKSFPSRPKIASRTGPPTNARVNPAFANFSARSDASGLLDSAEIARSAAIVFGFVVTVSKARAVTLLHDHGAWWRWRG